MVNFNPPAYFTTKISGSADLCRCKPIENGSIYQEFRQYSAEVEIPNGPNTGLPPYTYEWYWNQSGIFTNSNPGNLIGNTSSITVDVSPCDHLFLHLVVTSSDGVVLTDTKTIYTGACSACSDCVGFAGEADDRFRSDTDSSTVSNVYIDLSIQPNPTTDKIVVTYSIDKGTKIKNFLIDVNGKIVSSINNTTLKVGRYTHTMSIEHLAPGIYLYVQQRGEQYFTEKIIKQ